jgi:O-antigen ligase
VHPAVSLEHLWLFDAAYLSGFNLLLAVRRRRSLRGLLLFAAANTVLLAVFGTFQRLMSAGLFFGAVAAPNPRFFATFIYGNHWSAYVALWFTVSIGLVFHYQGRETRDGPPGAPLGLGLIALLLMALTPLLAGSRSGTALILVVALAGVSQALLRIWRRRRYHGEPAGLPVIGLVFVVAVAIGGAFYLGRDSMRERWKDTRGQWRAGMAGERLHLYSDTWMLASQRPLFGWGLASYEKTLQLLRPRPVEERRQYEHSYVQAHSDWLQSLAEVGFVGSGLLLLTVLVPFWNSRSRQGTGTIPGHLLGGCGLVAAYAMVEFPFGNPAVAVAFWLCFFSALQYIRLRRVTA